MGVFTLALAGATAAYVHNQRKENKERRRKADDANQSLADAVRKGESPVQEDFRDATLPQVLSMLVDGVYHRDHKAIDFDILVKPFLEGEYEVDMRMVHYTSELYWSRMPSISEKEEKAVGLKHYVRQANHPNRLAPSLVIAIRGTKLSSGRDLADDIRISMETLDFSSRFEKCKELVKKIIMEFRTLQQQGYNHGYRERSAPAQHLDVQCDVCYMAPIIGTRYKSKKIYDYDLCQNCFQAYGAYNDYTKIDLPGSYPEPESSRRRDASVQHQGVRCDVCNMSPIIGTRYKSNKFYNYDLCQTCFQANGAINDYIRIDGDIYITGHSLGASVNMYISKLREEPHALKNWYRGPPIDEYQEFRVLPRPWLPALLGEVIPSFANTVIRSPQTSYNVDDSESDSDSG